MNAFWRFFSLGFALAFGPCLFSCAPVLFAYVFSSRKNSLEGLCAYLAFSAGRIITYCLLGFAAASFGQLLGLFLHRYSLFFQLILGIFLIGLALLLIFGKAEGKKCQNFFQRHFEKKNTTPFILGIFTGLSPCLPLLSVLVYIVTQAKVAWDGAVYGLAFGLGTFFSPLLLLSIFLPRLADFLDKKSLFIFFSFICGLIIFLLGLQILLHVFR
jgi:sulfite exporter TauE/SafE